MLFSPIVLFCYNRLFHLQQTVACLQANPEASESELWIFADGAKGEHDAAAVAAVRQWLTTIQGFKAVHIIAQPVNQGLARSIIQGVSQIISTYGRAIVLEDDILTSPDFLGFMNQGLQVYESRKDIYALTGWSPPLQFPVSYPYSVYLTQRPMSWGWATWVDRWERVDWQVLDFADFLQDKDLQKRFALLGEDVVPMLKKQQLGRINSWAIRWTYHVFKQGGYCLYPIQPKVHNIGTDGSGTNMSRLNKFAYQHHLTASDYDLPPDLQPDNTIQNLYARYFRLSHLRRWINYFTLH